MFRRTIRQRAGLGLFVVVFSIAGFGGVAQAALTDHSGAFHGCVGSSGALRVISPTRHCAHGERAIRFSGEGELTALRTRVRKLETKNTALTSRVGTLEGTLTGVSRSGNTLKFTGMNLQLLSGSGTTDGDVNGLGNLIIGYNENPATQTGSHNLILGTNQTFTSYGGIDAGAYNTISGPYASVTGGYFNTASGLYASVTGGYLNTASATFASVSGGESNTAHGTGSSVLGGLCNNLTVDDGTSYLGGGTCP